MLNLVDSSRRSFLQVGSLGLGGLTLPSLLQAQQLLPAPMVKDKSVVFLFMHGGPSQYETFDPKMDAPSTIRSMTGEIPTSIPGVTFGPTFERLAKLANKLSIVRSFTTGTGSHDIKPIVGKNSLGANIGSLYSRVAGTNVPETGMPKNIALYPQAVDPEAMPAIMKFGNFEATGPLSSPYAPFAPGSKGGVQDDMKLQLPLERFDDRRLLFERLDATKRAFYEGGAAAGMSELQQQAFDTILGGIEGAFDLSKEDPRTLARYDTAPLVNPNSIRKVWKNHQRYRDHGQTLGKLMLLSRRLCERGAGFVTVTTNFVWDMHADQNNATMNEGMGYVGAPFDHAVSAFIEDIEARGLSEKILLVCCGEMGRTPKINQRGGRDHWGRIAPLMIYGGGLKMGQVIGQSSRDGGEPASEPIGMDNLTATILNSVFDIGQVRLLDGFPTDVMNVLTTGKPIEQLI
ncbi:MAG: hypothetical protein ACI8UO_002795 [Verrucomicrobiales bacterium]|jgi:hypothetical protein